MKIFFELTYASVNQKIAYNSAELGGKNRTSSYRVIVFFAQVPGFTTKVKLNRPDIANSGS